MGAVITVDVATLNDWVDIQAVLARLSRSRFAQYVNGSPEEMGNYLVHSLANPFAVGVLLLRWNGVACGVATMLAVSIPTPTNSKLTGQAVHGFVHAVYIDPWVYEDSAAGERLRITVPQAAGSAMCSAMLKWSRDRGAAYIYGNVRLDGHFSALEKKFGFVRQHIVIGRSTEEVTENGQYIRE